MVLRYYNGVSVIPVRGGQSARGQADPLGPRPPRLPALGSVLGLYRLIVPTDIFRLLDDDDAAEPHSAFILDRYSAEEF